MSPIFIHNLAINVPHFEIQIKNETSRIYWIIKISFDCVSINEIKNIHNEARAGEGRFNHVVFRSAAKCAITSIAFLLVTKH